MKRIDTRCLAILPIMAAALTYTSCIFEYPDNDFCGTVWEADEFPLGPFSIEEITLEFTDGNSISIKTDNSTTAIHGTYDCNGETVLLHGLALELEGYLVTFIDAQLTGGTLFLRWRVENSVYPFTTAMHKVVEG